MTKHNLNDLELLIELTKTPDRVIKGGEAAAAKRLESKGLVIRNPTFHPVIKLTERGEGLLVQLLKTLNELKNDD